MYDITIRMGTHETKYTVSDLTIILNEIYAHHKSVIKLSIDHHIDDTTGDFVYDVLIILS